MNTKPDEFPIPSTYSRIIARILGLQERQLPTLLNGTGLATDILMPGDETYITGQQQLRVMANGQRILNSPAFGLYLGAQLQPSAHGPLGYLALSSPDLMGSLESLRDFLPVRLPLVSLEISMDADWLVCALQIKLAAKYAVRRAMCESFVLVVQALVEEVLGRHVTEAQIEFDHPEPPYRSLYNQYIHAPFSFSCDRVAYRIPASMAHAPNTCGDSEAYRVAQDFCTKLLKNRPHFKRSISDSVRTLLLAQPQGTADEESVARALYVSKRTLARRLRGEDTSYRAIREQALSELSGRYLLESKQSIESIAALLGYHDSAAFRKAFKRWRGTTPSEFRRLQDVDKLTFLDQRHLTSGL